jgi:hypothetical protein
MIVRTFGSLRLILMSNMSDVPHRLCRRNARGNDQRRSSYYRTDLTNHLNLHSTPPALSSGRTEPKRSDLPSAQQ